MMATRKPLAVVTAVVLAIALVAGIVVLVRQVFFGPNTITAYFPTATAIYPGDEVRVSGVKVGKIDSIAPDGTQTKMTLKVDHGVPVPADAKAVIVAQNLVAARYVQLTPAYRKGGGPTMRDGAVIPSDRTAVPVEWDEVKDPTDAPGNGIGPEGRGVGDLRFAGSSTARRTRWTATATSYDRRWPNCPAPHGSSPKAAATSSTSSRTCRPSSPRCATAKNRSSCSRIGWPV